MAEAKPEMYHPMQDGEQLVIDAINVGLATIHKAPEEELGGRLFLCLIVIFAADGVSETETGQA